MCKTLTGIETNLVAYYSFDNTSGTTLQSIETSTTNDLSLTNMTDDDWVSSTAFNTWLNTNSSTWSAAANWSGGIPSSGANVGIYNLTNEPDIPTSQTFGNLYLGSGISTTLSVSMTVNGSLILDKDLGLNGQTITLGESANLIESNGNLYGTSGTIQTTRSLSNIDEDVAGLGAEIQASGDLGSTTITRGHTAQGSQGIERYYHITTSNSPSNDTLVFNYLDSELNGKTESTLKLFKSSDGSTWAEQSSSTVDVINNTLTLTSIDGFSYWTAAPAGSDASLPVELSSFTATDIRSSAISLVWVTESEIENLGFILERREQETDWIEIASYLTHPELQGQGSVTHRTEYSYSDETVEPGQTYDYRLADVSYAGDVEYHNLLVLGVSSAKLPNDFKLYEAYPNPFNPVTTFHYDLPKQSHVVLMIYDLLGRDVITLVNRHEEAGYKTIQWNATDKFGQSVSAGMYIYRIRADEFVQTRKCILLK